MSRLGDLIVAFKLVDLGGQTPPFLDPWGKFVVIGGFFLVALLVARSSAFLARYVLAWHDRRHRSSDLERVGGKMVAIKRRETLVGMIRAGVSYAAFAAAGFLSLGQLIGGVDKLTALAGASFLLILVGFSIQRLLTDIIAGLTMFTERWFSVGDSIAVAGLELQGVVDEVSLRRTKLRTLDGEVIHLHNSQIPAVRVLPRGVKELAVELFVSDRERAEQAVRSVASILPEGPTTFVHRPWIEQVDKLSETLVRIRMRATVAPGREWLVDGFFGDLVRERAGDLLVHGPVVLSVDASATRSFARASAAMRWSPAASGG